MKTLSLISLLTLKYNKPLGLYILPYLTKPALIQAGYITGFNLAGLETFFFFDLHIPALRLLKFR